MVFLLLHYISRHRFFSLTFVRVQILNPYFCIMCEADVQSKSLFSGNQLHQICIKIFLNLELHSGSSCCSTQTTYYIQYHDDGKTSASMQSGKSSALLFRMLLVKALVLFTLSVLTIWPNEKTHQDSNSSYSTFTF